MLNIEYDVPIIFAKYNFKTYFTIQKDCYRLTLIDEITEHQTMFFIPKIEFTQTTELTDYVLNYTQLKNPELFI